MKTLWSRLDKHWRDTISVEFNRSNMGELETLLHKLEQFLQREKDARHTLYPKDEEIFNALNLTAFNDIKVVIIGQDPYHGEGQAHGLCFSVPKDIKEKEIPPSLRNIYEEIKKEYDSIKMPPHGDLTEWAKQGVLLLNAVLTVQQAKPGSHKGKGWEKFTDAIIRAISKERKHVVFLLWGSYAREKRELINREKHLVLESSHPSPLSARHGFVGCGHFKKSNGYLMKHGRKPVEWKKI